MTKLPILILAAGTSSRMRGTDKLMQEVDGQPLVTRQARLVRDVTSGPVIVTLPSPPHPRYQALAGLDVTLVPVPDAADGMGASLRVAFSALPKDARAAMLILGDLPCLQSADLKTVFQAVDLTSETEVWRGATSDGKPGHPIVFAAALFPAMTTLHGDTGGQDVIAKAGDKVVLVPLPGHRARRDLDTPEDWAAWRAEHQTGGRT